MFEGFGATKIGVSLSSILEARTLWIIFFTAFALYGLVSAIIFYHWSAYGENTPVLRAMKMAYIFGSLFLFTAAGVFIFLAVSIA